MATAVDVTVRGAGVFGLATAFVCARRGARVRVIDPGGVAAGASGGPVGALAPHTPETWNPKKQFQLESLLMAEGFWADVETLSGRPTGYGRIGRIQALPDMRSLELAHRRAETAKALWQGHARWEVIDSAPFAPLSATGHYVHDTLSARLQPKAVCEALAAALPAMGADVVPEGPDEGRVLWATGVAGLDQLSAAQGRSMGGAVKGQALVLGFDAGDSPQLYADGLHIVPHDTGTVAVGSTSERDFTDPTATDALLDAVHARAVALCPALDGAPVLQRWAGLRPRAKTRAPMLGAWPDRPGHFVANGGFKIGFGMAPKVADVMADLVLDGRDAVPCGFRVEDNL